MSMPVERIINEQSAISDQLSEDGNNLSSLATHHSSLTDETLADLGFYWRGTGGVRVLVCGPLEDAGFANGFSTRHGGVSPFPSGDLNLAGFDEDSAENIHENRRRFLASFDHDYALATAWQVHGDEIKIIRNETDILDSEKRADALVSDLTDVLVGVKTADCVPILLGDTKTKAFAAVHAGWRGTVQSIAAKAVAKMKELYRTDSSEIIAAIGPAATCRSYEIGRDVMAAFVENFAGSDKYFKATRDGHALVDLHLANRDQLLVCGVPDENIFTAPYCTMERTDLFFSYRKEKKTFGRTGRLLSVIGRK